MRLRTHLLLVALVGLLPVIVFSAVLMFLHIQQRRATSFQLLEAMTQEAAEDIDEQMRKLVAGLQALGQSDALRTDDLPAFHALARRLVKAENWEKLQLLGPAGEHLVDTTVPFGAALPPLRNPDLALKAAAADTPLMSDLEGGGPDRPLTTIYVPAARQQGRLKYVIAVSIAPSRWEHLIDDPMGARRDMYTLVLDGRSRVVAGTYQADPTQLAGDLRRVPFDVAEFAREGGSPQVGTMFGQSVYVVWRKVKLSGWTAISFMPVAAFDMPVRRLALEMGAAFLLFLALGLGLTLWLARRTTRSITELVASVQSVAMGAAPHPTNTDILEVQHANAALGQTAALLASRLKREELVHARLEQADRAKNEFLALLGHELRNPLAAIRNSVELVKQSGAGTDAGRWAISVVDRQSTHLSRLVNDLLDVTRIDHGKIELRREVVDLGQLLKDTVQDHRGVLRKPGVILTLDIPPDPVMVNCDRVRVAQVIGNLLHNAAKFTPTGGRITAHLSRHDHSAVLEVRDTGSGMAPESVGRMFELFAQEHPSGAGGTAGLGLGLALARKLVTLHGGTITGASAGRGRGSTFRVELPAMTAAPAGAVVA